MAALDEAVAGGVAITEGISGFQLYPHLLRLLLAAGRPVPPDRLAAASGWPVEQVEAAARGHQGAGWDERGRLLALDPQGPIAVMAGPKALIDVQPAEAVAALVAGGDPADQLRTTCDIEPFFASAAIAREWQAQHPQAHVMTVADAFRGVQDLVNQLYEEVQTV